MSKTIGSISFYETEIIIKYDIGFSKKFKTKIFPKYQVGTQWIDFNGERFFLVDEE
jgi:hypothetical protein